MSLRLKQGAQHRKRVFTPPERWVHCPRRSQSLIAGVFVATKTFLDDKYSSHIPDGCEYSVGMMCDIERNLKCKIGIVIDLTLSQKFYHHSAVENLGKSYVKIQCTGHDDVPNAEQVRVFMQVCKTTLDKNPDQKILVHCTHGFNRTGFMIISFLVEQGWSVFDALKHFAMCRSPGIYKETYIAKILQLYRGEEEGVGFPTPPLPDWCFKTNDGTEVSTKRKAALTASLGAGPERLSITAQVPTTEFPVSHDKISFVSGPDAEAVGIDFCSYFDTKGRLEFPGSQPVSLSRESLQLVRDKPYNVSWKADGIRLMMYIKDKSRVYMVDREFNTFLITSFTFPRKGCLSEHVTETILDGEMVHDKDGDKLIPRYLIFDMMVFEGMWNSSPFSQRMEIIKNEIIEPRNEALRAGLLNRADEPFSVRKKDFFNKSHTRWLLEKFVRSVTHETDGLLFQPENEEYKRGPWSDLLKWKPEHLNSVDFLLDIVETVREGCLKEREGLLRVLNLEQPFAKMKVTNALKKYDKRIIECTFDKVQGWKFLRLREDKCSPNAFNTAKNVYETMLDPVTTLDLFQALSLSDANQSQSTNSAVQSQGNHV